MKKDSVPYHNVVLLKHIRPMENVIFSCLERDTLYNLL
jgi:hypothetical protein